MPRRLRSPRRGVAGSGRRNSRITNARTVGDRDHDRRVGGDQRGQQHAGDGRTRRLLQRRTDRPLEPVRREQLLRRQDARQDRAVGREEEPRAGAEHERDDHELRDADRRRTHPTTTTEVIARKFDELTTARTISRRDTRSATMPPGIAHSSSPVAFDAATSERSSGPPPVAITA